MGSTRVRSRRLDDLTRTVFARHLSRSKYGCRAWYRVGMSERGWMQRESAAGKKGELGETEDTGKNSTDRSKCGSKRQVLSDARGIPLALVLSGANRHDMKKLWNLLEAIVIARPDLAHLTEGIQEHLCPNKGHDHTSVPHHRCRAGLHRAYQGQG